MQTFIIMQKTSSFHLFIQIKSVIESRPQIRRTHFGTYPPKRLQSLFNLHEFVPACKKSVIFYFVYFFFFHNLHPNVHSWDTVNLRVQRPYWPNPFFTMPSQKNFDQLLLFANFYQHAKWGCFIYLFWRNSWFKNWGIWFAEGILAYIWGIRFLTNIGFVQEHRK